MDREFVNLRQRPQEKENAAQWFHRKWGVPQEAYLACMEDYIARRTEYGGTSAWTGSGFWAAWA